MSKLEPPTPDRYYPLRWRGQVLKIVTDTALGIPRRLNLPKKVRRVARRSARKADQP